MKYGCVACDWKGRLEDTFTVEDTDEGIVLYSACPRCWAECQPLFDEQPIHDDGRGGNTAKPELSSGPDPMISAQAQAE